MTKITDNELRAALLNSPWERLQTPVTIQDAIAQHAARIEYEQPAPVRTAWRVLELRCESMEAGLRAVAPWYSLSASDAREICTHAYEVAL